MCGLLDCARGIFPVTSYSGVRRNLPQHKTTYIQQFCLTAPLMLKRATAEQEDGKQSLCSHVASDIPVCMRHDHTSAAQFGQHSFSPLIVCCTVATRAPRSSQVHTFVMVLSRHSSAYACLKCFKASFHCMCMGFCPTVAAQNIGPLEHVCWVRNGYLLESQVLVQGLQRPNIWC